MLAMESTFEVYVGDDHGGWYPSGYGEIDAEQQAREAAGQMYGGTASTRVVRVDRVVVDEVVR